MSDAAHMRHAIALSKQGLGRVGNARPSVGCVLVKKGVVIAAARTGDGGAPHAEAAALIQAGDGAKGASAYVTLEPCAHQGKTPPCAKALIDSGIRRVIIACEDPFEHVDGRGIQMLKEAGIELEMGLMREEARAVNAGFFLMLAEGRPFVTLKAAMSIDGKIALGNGKSQWITGELARRHVHLLRSRNDAILVGGGTVKADQPRLTTRLSGVDHKSIKVILGPKLLINDEEMKGDPKDLKAVLETLTQFGVTRLLVEGGAQVFKSFLEYGYVDELYVYRAPTMMGADALSALSDMEFTSMDHIERLKRQKTQRLGEDILEIYAQAH